MTLTYDLVSRIITFGAIACIIRGRNPKFVVWIPRWMAQWCTLTLTLTSDLII